MAKKLPEESQRFIDLVNQARELRAARRQVSKLEKVLESPRKRRMQKRVADGPVLNEGSLVRAVREGGNVVPERFDPSSASWVRSGVSLADVAAGRPVSGEEMEALGCLPPSLSGLSPNSEKNEQAQKSPLMFTKDSNEGRRVQARGERIGELLVRNLNRNVLAKANQEREKREAKLAQKRGQPSQKMRPEEQWQTLLGVFADVLENQAQRIGEEWSWFGGAGEPGDLMGPLGRCDPVLALRKFEEVNPNLDMDKLKNAESLQPEERYDYAVRILVLVAPDD